MIRWNQKEVNMGHDVYVAREKGKKGFFLYIFVSIIYMGFTSSFIPKERARKKRDVKWENGLRTAKQAKKRNGDSKKREVKRG